MDDVETYENGPVETVGQALKAAREAKGKSIEDIASATRIPTRHLESLENSDWERLPASTYTIGFAKAYAGEVGVDRAEIGERLRDELGGYRPPVAPPNDYFAPSDPKRTIPVGMVIGAIVAIALLALGLNWLLNRDLTAADTVPENAVVASEQAPLAAAPAAQPAVLVTASQPVWVDIRDGATILKQGELLAGQSVEIPVGAANPTLSTARPEALRISVGTADAPPVGQPGVKVTNVSLKPDALMAAQSAAPQASAPAPAPARQARPAPSRRSSAPAPAAVAPEPATVTPAPTPSAPATNTAG